MTRTSNRWWAQRAALALAMVAATLPLWFVRLPPLIDLLGHMGRYHVEANLAHSPELAAHWAYHWRLIGNLGGDLIMALVVPWLGAERSAVILGGLILVVMMSGMVRLSRAAHGQLAPTVWAAFLLAMSYPWHYGLVNYWLGVGLALHAAAFVWPMRPDPRHAVWLGILSFGLWTAHIYGWAIFTILIVARSLTQSSLAQWPRRCVGLLPLGVPLLVMAAARYGTHGSSAQTLGWFQWEYKAVSFSWTFRDQIQLLDLSTLLAVIILIVGGCVSRRLRIDRALGVAALLLLAAVILLPYQLFGSAYADGRLWPVVLLIAVLAIRPAEPDSRLSLEIATIAAVLFVARLAFTTIGFQAYDTIYAKHLAAIERVPRGAQVAVFVDFPCNVEWRRPRLEHLDGAAIARRDLFTNGQWDVPGAELLVPLAARGTNYNSDPSELVRSCNGNAVQAVGAEIARFPRDRFDYVWLIGYRPATLPRYPGLSPAFADAQTILYRVDHDPPAVDRRTLLQRSRMPARAPSPAQ